MKDIFNILEDSLPELNEISREKKIYMQMDNARIHWTLDALRFYKENNIVVIDWPAYSPDLNPIENVWAYIKGKLSGKKFISMKQIETEIIKIWESIPKIQIEKTCESIYDRLGDCIEMKGRLIIIKLFLLKYFSKILFSK